MADCRVPKCGNKADREICKPHWRKVPGNVKREIMITDREQNPRLYDELIDEAVAKVAGVRLGQR